ncbi:MAG: hypothetical protein ACKVQA_08090 [Burkholderiales bacterium]
MALSRQEVNTANWFAGCLLFALLSFCAWLVLATETLLVLALVSGPMVIPISSALSASAAPARRILLAYTVVLRACGAYLVAAFMIPAAEIPVGIPFAIFLVGVVTFLWVSDWVQRKY